MRLDLFPLESEPLDGLLTRLMEECAEVIQAAAKVKRFGLGAHPAAPAGTDNRRDLLAEIDDVRMVADAVATMLRLAEKDLG